MLTIKYNSLLRPHFLSALFVLDNVLYAMSTEKTLVLGVLCAEKKRKKGKWKLRTIFNKASNNELQVAQSRVEIQQGICTFDDDQGRTSGE